LALAQVLAEELVEEEVQDKEEEGNMEVEVGMEGMDMPVRTRVHLDLG
jgi:hypothetical protein